jgi:hypothetical protein
MKEIIVVLFDADICGGLNVVNNFMGDEKVDGSELLWLSFIRRFYTSLRMVLFLFEYILLLWFSFPPLDS